MRSRGQPAGLIDAPQLITVMKQTPKLCSFRVMDAVCPDMSETQCRAITMCKYRTISIKSLLLSLLMLASSTVQSEEIFFLCELRGNGFPKNYSFSFDEEKQRLYLTEGSQEMELLKINSTQIWARNSVKIYRDFDYDNYTLYLNRITGEAEVSYTTKPSQKEIEDCEANTKSEHKFHCQGHPVLTGKTEKGVCKRTLPKI